MTYFNVISVVTNYLKNTAAGGLYSDKGHSTALQMAPQNVLVLEDLHEVGVV